MGTSFERRLEVLMLHADRRTGSKYWQEFFRKSKYGVEEIAHNPLLAGVFDLQVLRDYPIEHFIPAKVLESRECLVIGETSGFSGVPIVTAFTEEELVKGFVDPFISQAELVGFPLKVNWLWGGPTGPHIIGKAVDAILKKIGGIGAFSVDFDPRWYKKMPEDSINRQRYFSHLIEQMRRHMETQNIEVLFTTPPMIKALASKISESTRNKIKGVHYGGMAISNEDYYMYKKLFPNAVHMSGYGNSLFGMYPETGFSERGIHYKTISSRIDLEVVEVEPDGIKKCAVGQRGRVMLSRYDRSMLLINVLERDEAEKGIEEIIDPRPPRGSEKKVLY
ncbi:MAG: hypothetical protein ACRC37_04345 [Lentisphaeria bacterium]